jgi:hypothetical protein
MSNSQGLAQYGQLLLEDGKALWSFLNPVGCGDRKNECRNSNRTEKGEDQKYRGGRLWEMPAFCQEPLSWREYQPKHKGD